MDKDNVIYTYKGRLLSVKKERNSTICDNMAGPLEHYAK
jgi:hypothetical protein